DRWRARAARRAAGAAQSLLPQSRARSRGRRAHAQPARMAARSWHLLPLLLHRGFVAVDLARYLGADEAIPQVRSDSFAFALARIAVAAAGSRVEGDCVSLFETLDIADGKFADAFLRRAFI